MHMYNTEYIGEQDYNYGTSIKLRFGNTTDFNTNISIWWNSNHILNSLRPGHAFDTLKRRQNGRHFADDILKSIFLNENVWIPIEISFKFVPKGPIRSGDYA